jgi:glucarate dehydratase
VPVIGYIFRKHANEHGESVLSTSDIVAYTRDLVDRCGFQTIKLKAGAVEPDEDVEAAQALRATFPRHNLRVDPNAAWSLTTALRVARQLVDLDLEWLEDPVLTIDGMGEVARRLAIPLATNMCCIQPRDFPAAVAARAIDVMLLDLWFLGGPWSARQMAATCRTFAVDIGVHSGGGNCEMGIGLAAQLHLAATLSGLTHAMDSEMHHLADDVIIGGRMRYRDGCLDVPSGPGLGVELDPERVDRYAELHRQLTTGTRTKPFPAYPRW